MTDLAPAARPQSTSLDDTPVGRIMHPGVFECALETPLVTVATLMATHHVHCLVGFGDFADDDTRLWGIVSDFDVVAALATGGQTLTAGDIASAGAVTIRAEESVRRATELMRDHEVSHLVVTDVKSDRPLGVISTLDVMTLLAGLA